MMVKKKEQRLVHKMVKMMEQKLEKLKAKLLEREWVVMLVPGIDERAIG
jgi:uncharacterized protein YaaR (DUF327 family)